jgi:tetratricopeptide (TPR) repeat protein
MEFVAGRLADLYVDDPPKKDVPLTGRLTEVALAYQQTLLRDPQNAEALLGMGLVALATGQTADAVKMAQAGVAAAPGMGPAWVTLGQTLKASGKIAEAEAAYTEAIRMDGMDVLARLGLGELRMDQNRPADAMAEFGLALKRRPSLVAAWIGMGNAKACQGRFAEAFQEYSQALALKPKLAEAEFAAGYALMRLGRYAESEQRYRRALSQRPDFAAAWLNLGCLEREMGKDVFAEAALQRAVELRPELANAWINLALIERDRKRPEKAEEYLRKALALCPDEADTHVAWAQFRAGENDVAGAWAWLRWALQRQPGHLEAWNMMGILLHKEQRYAEAVEAFRQAEELGHMAAASNRGNTLLDLGRAAEALEAHKAAAERDPESAGAQYNLALTRLRMGEWAQGWAEYESRWRFRQVHKAPRKFRQPRWQGQALRGQGVLLHAEQGLGDTIQFSRYAAMVVARGGHPILLVQKAAERLMRSLPVVRSGQAAVARAGERAEGFDFECPLMSLPAVFGTIVDTVPWMGPYLAAEPELVHEKQHRFPALGAGPRIGICWAGNSRYKADAQRSTVLSTLLPLLRTPGFEWISLQKGEPAAQIDELPDDVLVADGSSQEKNLAEAAALLATLDAVVTTDTCIAHLAGAMGKPVWILLPFLSDWRWMQQRETTPWYPTAQLLRQTTPGDWDGVLVRAVKELSEFRRTHWRAAS